MDILLKLKHWQIFLLVVGIPIVIQFIQTIWIVASGNEVEAGSAPSLGLLIIIPLLIYYLWIQQVGKKFSRSEGSPPMKTKKFLLSVWVSCFSNFFLFIYFWFYPYNLDRAEGEEVIPITVIALILFIALMTLFHCLSFMAKALVQLEREREITSSEFFSEFVMAVIFPIGIWLLQPRINQLEIEKD
jgi:hypothetical protein